jgi:hypothetical protein
MVCCNTDLYRLKERSTLTEVMGANFIFSVSKGHSVILPHSFCNVSLINFRQFKPGFLFNTLYIFSFTATPNGLCTCSMLFTAFSMSPKL